ncbi:(1-_4)-alpha-D-glucan synthase (UDP-glucose) [Sanguibacter gelidistatuariae]|uniref:D-inositol 3-phosphate glycosyltransferase n=1 Tax=Sanguibacter gelidistatuariae TaxID=1814289 RepID=A0A1G6QD06_9MICO|nr:glycosyltransferase family 4 protein [Sanguibacter gelidistatuariae]SDC90183.1 (1->4)-alpha-D-glucan synthase (UDP-glucose) [Sanguibacter gelidistatuariae]
MDRLRIALVSSSYEPYTGGVEEHTRRVAAVLAARGHQVEVWTVDRGEHLGVTTLDGLVVRYLPAPLPARSPTSLLRFTWAVPGASWAWWRALRTLRPDVVHVQCFGPNGVYALALARMSTVLLVVSSHGETFADDHSVFDASRLIPFAMRSALERASAVTGCSQVVLVDLARRFPGRGSDGGVVVPNGVDLHEVETVDVREVSPSAAPTVLAVGRLQHVKGFDLLLRAFARATGEGAVPAGTRVRLGGDGPEAGPLAALASELGIRDRVDLLGRLDRQQVAAEMAAATVVVVPSRAESFGITVLEAWRAKAPVIATTRGGPPEFVSDGDTGLLVDPVDTTALAAALATVLADADLRRRLGENGYRLVRDEYTWERVADRYEELYGRA